MNNELITRKDVNGLEVIGTPEGYFASMGKYRVSEVFKTETEAIKDAKRTDMIRVMQIALIVTGEQLKEYGFADKLNAEAERRENEKH